MTLQEVLKVLSEETQTIQFKEGNEWKNFTGQYSLFECFWKFEWRIAPLVDYQYVMNV